MPQKNIYWFFSNETYHIHYLIRAPTINDTIAINNTCRSWYPFYDLLAAAAYDGSANDG